MQQADIYSDKDGSRKEEIAALGGQGGNVFTSFYDRLREVQDPTFAHTCMSDVVNECVKISRCTHPLFLM